MNRRDVMRAFANDPSRVPVATSAARALGRPDGRRGRDLDEPQCVPVRVVERDDAHPVAQIVHYAKNNETKADIDRRLKVGRAQKNPIARLAAAPIPSGFRSGSRKVPTKFRPQRQRQNQEEDPRRGLRAVRGPGVTGRAHIGSSSRTTRPRSSA
jgi:hypothetical protein